MAQSDVLDIEEDLVAALLVPDLLARVPRVLQDRPHGGLRPGAPTACAMAVAGRVVRGRRQDAIAGEPLRDRVCALAGQEVVEDPFHDGCCDWVGFESMDPLADGGLRWV